MEHIFFRRAASHDVPELAEMCHSLWPETSVNEHARDMAAVVARKSTGPLPVVLFVAERQEGQVVGFVEVGLRSHADGCDPSHPVGFIEGWYVAPAYRRRRIGVRLAIAAEDWVRSQGCTEMASDTWLDALASQRAHEALGFEIVDRCIHYRKTLGPTSSVPPASADAESQYS